MRTERSWARILNLIFSPCAFFRQVHVKNWIKLLQNTRVELHGTQVYGTLLRRVRQTSTIRYDSLRRRQFEWQLCRRQFALHPTEKNTSWCARVSSHTGGDISRGIRAGTHYRPGTSGVPLQGYDQRTTNTQTLHDIRETVGKASYNL
ncbi:hypothetical protein Bbelb_340280 [Branchiostoma belcheri]|nr:hypothetical protein Bbelb_340280 [Branchiostoma belcheri]